MCHVALHLADDGHPGETVHSKNTFQKFTIKFQPPTPPVLWGQLLIVNFCKV